MRAFISNPSIITFLELPFITILLLVIALLGGALVWIPIIAILAFGIMAMVKKLYSQQSENSAEKNYERQEFLLESLQKFRTIKMLQLEDKWIQRKREISGKNAFDNFKNSVRGVIDNTISDLIITGSGVILIACCAIKIMNQTLSI